MEFLLLRWDNLDDFTHACRHLATSALSEVADAAKTPFATATTFMTTWLLLALHR